MTVPSPANRTPARIFLYLIVGWGVVLGGATLYRPNLAKLMKHNIAAEAKQYLEDKNVTPIVGEVAAVVSDETHPTVNTQEHALLGKEAPNFELLDDQEQPISLPTPDGSGAVVLVFYYGYHCNHCVGQLFALDADYAKFQELGAVVLAVSADPVEETRKRFDEYGRFQFPVLSDPGNRVAEQYGIYVPPLGDQPESLVHGTFIIATNGRITWCNRGDEPFTDNRTLLKELVKAGSAPSSAALSAPTVPQSPFEGKK